MQLVPAAEDAGGGPRGAGVSGVAVPLAQWVQGQVSREGRGRGLRGGRVRLTSASGKLRSWAAACVPKTRGQKNLPYLVKAALGLGKGRLQTGGRQAPRCALGHRDMSFARALQMCRGMDGSGEQGVDRGEHHGVGEREHGGGGNPPLLPAAERMPRDEPA